MTDPRALRQLTAGFPIRPVSEAAGLVRIMAGIETRLSRFRRRLDRFCPPDGPAPGLSALPRPSGWTKRWQA